MLIVFEGIDGAGKTALADAVSQLLKREGVPSEITSELGRHEPWSKAARAQLMAARNKCEQYNAVMGARLAHRTYVLHTAPAKVVVLMDRYLPSTIAYQGCITLPPSAMLADHDKGELPVPDHTFLIRLPAQLAIARTQHRGNQDKFDLRGEAHFEDLQRRLESALSLLSARGWSWSTLDGELPLGTLAQKCAEQLKPMYAQHLRQLREVSPEVEVMAK